MTHASGYFAAADPARLRSLSRYSIMESPREREFDDLVALTRVVTGYTIAGIGFVDERRVWFKSMLGAESSPILSHAFAAHSLTADMMVVA